MLFELWHVPLPQVNPAVPQSTSALHELGIVTNFPVPLGGAVHGLLSGQTHILLVPPPAVPGIEGLCGMEIEVGIGGLDGIGAPGGIAKL